MSFHLLFVWETWAHAQLETHGGMAFFTSGLSETLALWWQLLPGTATALRPASDPVSERQLQEAPEFTEACVRPWLPKPLRGTTSLPFSPVPSLFPASGRGTALLRASSWILPCPPLFTGPSCTGNLRLGRLGQSQRPGFPGNMGGVNLLTVDDSYSRTFSWSSPTRKVDQAGAILTAFHRGVGQWGLIRVI